MKRKEALPFLGLAVLFVILTAALIYYNAVTAPVPLPVQVVIHSSGETVSEKETGSRQDAVSQESAFSQNDKASQENADSLESLPLLNPYPELEGVVIDINHATKEELEQLPGIGPVKAGDIVDYVKEKGPLTSLEELLEVKGIGEKTLEKLRPFLSIGAVK